MLWLGWPAGDGPYRRSVRGHSTVQDHIFSNKEAASIDALTVYRHRKRTVIGGGHEIGVSPRARL